MLIPSLPQAPWLYLSFASLHLLLGHFGSAFFYRLRFGKSPWALYQKGQNSWHLKISRWIAFLSLGWALTLFLSALSSPFQISRIGRPLFRSLDGFGWGLGGLALLGMLLSQIFMGPAFRIGQDESAETKQNVLKDSGLYQFSRNPIYLFSFLSLFGFTLWWPGPFLLFFCFSIGLCMHLLVLEEEKFLARQFGENFRRYCLKVPRYFLPKRKNK